MIHDCGWRVAGPAPDGSDMRALVKLDPGTGGVIERKVADVRGGVCWPFPKMVGTELVVDGCVVVLAFVKGKGSGEDSSTWEADLLRWCPCSSITTTRNEDGWPVDVGVSGRLVTAAADLGCLRWYSLAPVDLHAEAMRTVRKAMGIEMPGVRVTALQEMDPVKMAREVALRWGAPGRIHLPEDAVGQIDLEETEYAGKGAFPLTLAIGAVLKGWDLAPWKGRKPEPWEMLPEGLDRYPLHV